MSTIFNRLWSSFRDKEYRQIYAEGFSDSKIATQIKVLREQRGWTQQQLAEAAGMKQSRIATLEDVNYSSWSIRTLRRLARAFDLWLDVEFREFGAVWSELRDFSRESLTRHSFVDDPVFKDDETGLGQTIEASSVNTEVLSVPLTQEKIGGSNLGSALWSFDAPESYVYPWPTVRASAQASAISVTISQIPRTRRLPILAISRDIESREIQTPTERTSALAAIA